MYEETRHIVFFVNWMAYNQAQKGCSPGDAAAHRLPLLHARAGPHGRHRQARQGTERRQGIHRHPGSVFLDGFTFRRFLEDCYSENRRRMGVFDKELLRPSFLPQLAETALRRHAPVERALEARA